MATNLDLDDKLIREVVKAGKFKTKKEAVTVAMQEYLKLKKRLALVEMAGKVEYVDGYDYKAARRKQRVDEH